MFLKKNLITFGLLAAMAAMMASCTNEDLMYNPQFEEYTRAFIKEFGIVDPNQTWNTAQSSAITLDFGATTANSVKMYCKVEDDYYLIADLVNLSGKIDIPVDIPENTKDLIVNVDGTEYHAAPGTSLSCAAYGASRATSDTTIAVTQVGWYEFDSRTMQAIVGTNGLLPEGNATYSTYYDNGNIDYSGYNAWSYNTQNGYIVQDFIIDPGEDGEFIVYPMFYGSNLIHELGVYAMDADKNIIKTHKIFQSKDDTDMQVYGYTEYSDEVTYSTLPESLKTNTNYYTWNESKDDYYANFYDENGIWIGNGWSNMYSELCTLYENGELTALNTDYPPSQWDITKIEAPSSTNATASSFSVQITFGKSGWTSINKIYHDDTHADSYDVENYVLVRSKGYKVEVPEGVRKVGMYLISKPNPDDLSAIYTGTYPPLLKLV
ncbi:MAG: hypothetical protein LIP09_13395 [Bacteroidales bacterium]|nr:hypothetical protein [Bacteroidales bacterium]